MGPILEASPAALERAAEIEKLGSITRVLQAWALAGDVPDPKDELQERGALERPDRVRDAWVAALAPLCNMTEEYIANKVVDGDRLTAVAVIGQGGATLALRRQNDETGEDVVNFREAKEEEVVDRLLDLLELQPGGGHPLSIPVEEIREIGNSVFDVPPSQAYKQLMELGKRPKAGPPMEIVVGMRDGNRKYKQTEHGVSIAHVDWGQYITYTTGSGTDARYEVAPASREYVKRALDYLRSTLH